VQSHSLEDLTVGQSADATHVVTEADVLRFAEVSGDHNPVHLDEAYAEATRFKGRIAHGMLTAGYISALLGNALPGPGSIYDSQSLNFKRPVRIGDEVTTRVTIEAIDEAKGLVTVATACTVRGKAVLDGQAVVMVARREAA
jgi:3-hydroxybutyryl-CoA dehydratase